MLQSWNEDIKNGRELEQFIRRIALTPNLGNMGHLVNAFDSVRIIFFAR